MAYTKSMESISRNVGDLTATERQVYETVLGHRLRAGQQIVVQLLDVDANDVDANGGANPTAATSPSVTPPQQNSDANTRLPEWCDVYRGLSDEQVAEVEEAILTRSTAARNIDVEF
jgi:hypothetical protein